MPERKRSLKEVESDITGTEQKVRRELNRIMPPEQVQSLMNQLNVLKIRQISNNMVDILDRLRGMKNLSASFMLRYLNDYLKKKDKLMDFEKDEKKEEKKMVL